jgi:hypothetical protein
MSRRPIRIWRSHHLLVLVTAMRGGIERAAQQHDRRTQRNPQ